jgi:hypothetical protein
MMEPTTEAIGESYAEPQPGFVSLATKTVMCHTLTYMVMGALVYHFLNYAAVIKNPNSGMPPATSLWVLFGAPLPVFLGVLFASVLYPLRGPVVRAQERLAADCVAADRDRDSGDICRTGRIAGRLHLSDHSGRGPATRLSGGCAAGTAAFGVVVLLGESFREAVAELDAGRAVWALRVASVAGAAGAEEGLRGGGGA